MYFSRPIALSDDHITQTQSTETLDLQFNQTKSLATSLT